MNVKLILAASALAAMLGASAPAQALTWTVSGTLEDGGTVSGFFGWTPSGYLDSSNGSLSIVTTSGTLLSGTTYSVPGSFPDGAAPANGFVITNGYFQVLSIAFQHSLTIPGIDPIVIGVSSFECYSYSCPPGGPDTGAGANTRYFTAGEAIVTATPLPAALPLFASGMGGLGFIGWWRKRRRVRTSKLVAA
jgi:hypothetical protein